MVEERWATKGGRLPFRRDQIRGQAERSLSTASFAQAAGQEKNAHSSLGRSCKAPVSEL